MIYNEIYLNAISLHLISSLTYVSISGHPVASYSSSYFSFVVCFFASLSCSEINLVLSNSVCSISLLHKSVVLIESEPLSLTLFLRLYINGSLFLSPPSLSFLSLSLSLSLSNLLRKEGSNTACQAAKIHMIKVSQYIVLLINMKSLQINATKYQRGR